LGSEINEGEFFNNTENYTELSEEARELIEGMLKPKIEERFNIHDVLDSEWLNQ
jgi:hypothetical protein